VRHTVGIAWAGDHAADPSESEPDRRADCSADDDRNQHAPDAPDARERRPVANETAEQRNRHEHLEQIPARLAEGGAER
jgi:hypothetical protein